MPLLETGTYVVCLDCGTEFPYDWKNMRALSITHCQRYSGAPRRKWKQKRAELAGDTAMNTQRRSFRVQSDVVISALCYVWYNPAIHIALVRVMS